MANVPGRGFDTVGWPRQIWIVRHGESAGNVARDAAYASGLAKIDIADRDVDVPLSQLGSEQSAALADWFSNMPSKARPNVVVCSPYRRAQQTAQIIENRGGFAEGASKILFDERLREKEFGILDRLTPSGIQQLHPEQQELRRILGKFYHRPPGGESWCDVILRLRSAIDTIGLHYSGQRVLIVAHQVVVLCMRYLLENLTEKQVVDIDADGDVSNCSVTEYHLEGSAGTDSKMVLRRYNFVAPLERAGTPVTDKPDANVASR